MQPGKKIYVVNPNSLDAVTGTIDATLGAYRSVAEIECLTVADGPPGIVTQSDVDEAVAPLRRVIASRRDSACAFIIACYSDPGLHGLRDTVPQPVLGIGECGLLTACSRGQRIGVIAISSKAIPRHYRYYGAMGLVQRLAGERAIDMSFAELAQPERAMARMTEVGRELRDLDGADVLVLGCAGMGAMRAGLEDALGLPVVDPCHAAMAMALGSVLSR